MLGPLGDVLGDRPIVVVPTGSLRSVPWALLPGCVGRPVTVAPSASVWLRAAGTRRRRAAGRRVVLVCGPGLEGAKAEIADLATAYPDAVRLEGSEATVERVQAALDGAGIAHIAAHGVLRGDNPLFSALTMSDGPLTAYDLERLSRAPQLVLLPACQSGAGAVLAGDEVMGLTSALFGARCPYRRRDRHSGAGRGNPATDARTARTDPARAAGCTRIGRGTGGNQS